MSGQSQERCSGTRGKIINTKEGLQLIGAEVPKTFPGCPRQRGRVILDILEAITGKMGTKFEVKTSGLNLKIVLEFSLFVDSRCLKVNLTKMKDIYLLEVSLMIPQLQ